MRSTAICVTFFVCVLCFAPVVFASDGIAPAPPPPPPLPTLADLPPAGALAPLPYAYAQPDDAVPEDEIPPAEAAVMEEAAPDAPPPPPVAAPAPTVYYAPADITPADIAPPPAPTTGARLTRAEGYPSGDDCSPDCAQRRDDCCWALDCRGCRYGRFEVTLEGMSSTFVEAATDAFGLPDYGTADQLDYDGLDYGSFFDEFGGRLTLAYAISPQEWVQLRGTYYGQWSSSARDTGTFAFAPGPGGLGGAIAPNAATFTSNAEAYGGELNWIMEISCRGDVRWNGLIGLRYFQFDEDLTADGWAAPFAGFNTPAYARSEVENTFLGLQIGGSVERDLGTNWTLMAGLKGLLGNMNRTIAVSDRSFFAGGTHAAASEDDEFVWGVDLELSVKWRLTSRIALTGGYNFLMMDGVQRAHDAMDFTKSNSGAIQAQQKTDQATIHSLFFGVNFNF